MTGGTIDVTHGVRCRGSDVGRCADALERGDITIAGAFAGSGGSILPASNGSDRFITAGQSTITTADLPSRSRAPAIGSTPARSAWPASCAC